ncbi:Cupredoxin [Infundibulicybe gibba]|nr:Cupredoxin [Infundibulicybe gibba]
MVYFPAVLVSLIAIPVALATRQFNVTVGANNQLLYDPPFIHADEGDIVNFIFNPKNHTVTQSAFETPCDPLYGGYDSGFVPVDAGAPPKVLWFRVPHASEPIWFHCQQTGHCGQGMVFAINPPAEPSPKSFNAFRNLAIATSGAGRSTSYNAPPSSSKASLIPYYEVAPMNYKIIVGADGKLEYTPANIKAKIYDTVTFEFRPKNHTVTQSSFESPCKSLAESTNGYQTGFKSGFMPVAADATTFPTFTVKVMDDKPIWGYCGQVNHCASGMVFAINAPETGPNTFGAFLDAAKKTAKTT